MRGGSSGSWFLDLVDTCSTASEGRVLLLFSGSDVHTHTSVLEAYQQKCKILDLLWKPAARP